MNFRIKETGAIVSEYDFRAMHPNVSFPAVIDADALAQFGADGIEVVAQPTHTAFQTIEDGGAALDAVTGVWKQVWLVNDITDAAQIASITDSQEKQLVANYANAVQEMMNAEAVKKGYDDIKSASLRAGYPGPFNAEGVAFATWMDACWAESYRLMAEVKAGTMPMPTVEELVAGMPVAPVFA